MKVNTEIFTSDFKIMGLKLIWDNNRLKRINHVKSYKFGPITVTKQLHLVVEELLPPYSMVLPYNIW